MSSQSTTPHSDLNISQLRPKNEHQEKFWEHHDRDAYRCPDCGRRESHPDVEWLEVHHRDRDPFNGALSNLVALCRHCHHIRHGNSPPTGLLDWKMRALDVEEFLT